MSTGGPLAEVQIRDESQDDEVTEHTTTLPGRPLWSITYLDLVILLMIFFIMIVSMSHYETGKFDPVLKGVRDAFHAAIPLDLRDDPPDRRGRAIDDTFVNGVGQLFSDELPLPHALIDRRGDYVAFTVALDALFAGNSAEPRPERDALFRRLAGLVQARPPSGRLEVEVLLSSRARPELAIQRLGSMARAMIGLGMPAHALSVGLAEDDPAAVRIVFTAVANDAPRVDFRGKVR
ncbi:MAG: hypothetical protein FJX35_20990 [Alphaproteobacteria bacterium]|nr:hypothetical protein [Alphaproteobacteria bacterium]